MLNEFPNLSRLSVTAINTNLKARLKTQTPWTSRENVTPYA